MITIRSSFVRNKQRGIFFIIYVAIAIVLLLNNASYAGDLPKWFPFNRRNALNEWKEKVFRGRVLYSVTEAKDSFLLAQSNKTCSGLFYEVRFGLISRPMISWKWKVTSFPKKEVKDAIGTRWVEKDDYAARFYVIFPKFPFTRTECIEYIWDERLPEETIKDSPYFKNIKLFVIESGEAKLGQWVFEERNVYEDYKKAFGRPPECSVGAIAIMTDSDNTLSTAEACYDEIKVGYGKNEKR